MSNLQQFNVNFEIWSAVFCAILAISVLGTVNINRAKAKWVIGLLVTNVILNIMESLAYFYRGNTSTVGFYMVRISNFTVLFCNMVLFIFMANYLFAVIEEGGGKVNHWAKRIIIDYPDLLIGARCHHERFDGKGYPDGLAGENIPLQARIIGVADAYDAMTSERSYRACLSQDKVRSEISKCSGTQFDPAVAKVMIEIIDSDKNYSLREHKIQLHNPA